MLDVTFYGVRGSTPTACERTRRYGGNTASVVLQVDGEPPLLLDLGTGLRFFGETQLDRRPVPGGGARVPPALGPRPGPAVLRAGRCARARSSTSTARPRTTGAAWPRRSTTFMRPPYFPVTIDRAARATSASTIVDEGRTKIGSALVTALAIPARRPHLRVPDRVGRRHRGLPARPPAARATVGSPWPTPPSSWPTASTCSCTTPSTRSPSSPRSPTWGHCTYEYAMWVAKRAGVGRLALFHHDPMRIGRRPRRGTARAARPSPTARGLVVTAAAEGQRISLGRRNLRHGRFRLRPFPSRARPLPHRRHRRDVDVRGRTRTGSRSVRSRRCRSSRRWSASSRPELDELAGDREVRRRSASTSCPSTRASCAGGSPRRVTTSSARSGWRPSSSGSPIIDGVLSWIDCDLEKVVEAGDHWFVMGRVRELEVETDHGPMLFFRGKLGGFNGVVTRLTTASPGIVVGAVLLVSGAAQARRRAPLGGAGGGARRAGGRRAGRAVGWRWRSGALLVAGRRSGRSWRWRRRRCWSCSRCCWWCGWRRGGGRRARASARLSTRPVGPGVSRAQRRADRPRPDRRPRVTTRPLSLSLQHL